MKNDLNEDKRWQEKIMRELVKINDDINHHHNRVIIQSQVGNQGTLFCRVA